MDAPGGMIDAEIRVGQSLVHLLPGYPRRPSSSNSLKMALHRDARRSVREGEVEVGDEEPLFPVREMHEEGAVRAHDGRRRRRGCRRVVHGCDEARVLRGATEERLLVERVRGSAKVFGAKPPGPPSSRCG